MFDSFRNFIDFILNNEIRSHKKLITLFIIMILTLGIDYFFRISETYITDKKISQLHQIYSLKENNKISKSTNDQLNLIEIEILKRKTFWNHISDLFSFIKSNINSNITTNNKKISSKPIIKNNYNFDLIFHVLSSCIFYIIYSLILPFAIYDIKDKLSVNLFAIFFSELIIWTIIFSMSYLYSFIPQLQKPFNYLINLALHIITIYSFNFLNNRSKN